MLGGSQVRKGKEKNFIKMEIMESLVDVENQFVWSESTEALLQASWGNIERGSMNEAPF